MITRKLKRVRTPQLDDLVINDWLNAVELNGLPKPVLVFENGDFSVTLEPGMKAPGSLTPCTSKRVYVARSKASLARGFNDDLIVFDLNRSQQDN